MPATTLAWNDPRVMNRVAEQYKQLRAQVDKLRALQKQVEQNGTTLTGEQRAQLELLPGALEDLRELREGRMPAHPIALLTAMMKQTTTTAATSGAATTTTTTTTAATTGKKAKRSRAKASAAVPAVTETTPQEEEEEATAAVPDNATTTTSVEETTTTTSTTKSSKNKRKAKGDRTISTEEEDVVPEADDNPADTEVQQQEENDKTNKLKKKGKKNKKAAAAEEEEAATVSDAEEDDPRDKATWLRRLSTQATAKARNALLEEYIEYYMSSPNATSPAALVAAEKKLKAAMECKRRILQCYEQGKPPSKKQLDTIEQLPALRKQVAQCARQVKLEAEKAKADLLAVYEAQQQRQQQQEEEAAARMNNEEQEQHEEADKTGSGSEQALMTDTRTTATTITAAETTNTLSPAQCLGSTMTLMGGSSTGLSTAITTGTTAPYSHASAEAMQAGSSISSLVATGEDEEVLVNVKTTEEEGGKEEEEERVKDTTSPQEEPCTEVEEEEEGDTNKIPDITPEATTEEGTATPITTTTTTMATMTLAEEETIESTMTTTADAILQSVPPAAHITIQSGSEWARVLRYAAPTTTGTTISTPLSTKARTTTSNNDDNGSNTPVATKRRPAGLTTNSNFTLRGFYSLIPRSSALAYNAEPTQRNNKSEESEESQEEEQQQKRNSAGRRLSSASSTSVHTNDTASQLTSTKQKKKHTLMQKLPCMAVAETTPATLSYYRLQLGLNNSPDQQQVNDAPSGKEVDEHTRRLLSALTATSTNTLSDSTMKKEEETCGLRGRPMLRARLAADWAAVQAALPNELPGMSLLACCDHTAHKANDTNTITTTTAAPVMHANTPLVSWLVSYSPRCGPLAGQCVPLELVFLPSYPFTAPRLFSLVSLPHPHLVLAQGGRANMLYLPTSTLNSGTSTKNEISRSGSTLSLPASPCSPTNTTTSLVSSSVLELLARVPAFFEGADFAEMARALGAEAFAAQLAQARLALGKVWLALTPALIRGSNTQWNNMRGTQWGAQQSSMWWSWRNGPYLTLSEDTAKDAENEIEASAEGTTEEKHTSQPQVVLHNDITSCTDTGMCGVRGPWRGCWGHLFYTLPSTVTSTEELLSTTSEHTRLPAGYKLHVELRRYITEGDGERTPSRCDSELERVSTLRLMRLPWTALLCEGDGTADEGTTHWAQQLLMQTNNEDSSGDEGSANARKAYWSLPSSAWTACNTSEQTAKVYIKSSQAETTTCLSTEVNEDNTTTLTLPNTSCTSDAEVTGCPWALMLDVPEGQTVAMTITLRPSASYTKDTNGVKAQEVHTEKNATEGSTVHGMLLSVPFGFSAAAITSALLHPLHTYTSLSQQSSAVNIKKSLGTGLCESTSTFYEDYYIPRCLGPLRGSTQPSSKTAASLKISESEFYLYRQLTPSSLHKFNSQKEAQESDNEKGLSVSCHDYLVVPPENVLRRALLQLEPSANSKANIKTATGERSRNVASRAERERHLREDYFWGLRVLFLPSMSPTVCDYVLSHALASTNTTPTTSTNAASLVQLMQPSEHEALYRFMQSCVQLYRQPAASTAYAVPLQPLHLLHFLSLTLWHLLLPLQAADQTEMKPSCSAAQHVVVLAVALAAKEQSLRDVCHRVVCDYADTLVSTSLTHRTASDKESGIGSDEPGVCTLFLQMPYFPLPSTTKQTATTAVVAEAEQKNASQTSTAQRAASSYRFVLNYLVSRLEGSVSALGNMDKATREAAAARYLTRLQCAALYLALQCVHQLSSETDSETCVDIANGSSDAQGSEEKVNSMQRAMQILNELQRDEQEGKEMVGAEDEGIEARRTLRYIHQCIVLRAATL